ncbi:MAG: hypothetical protein ACJAWV_004187, partial [Flammeovirgaceae bacterium]
MRCTQNKWDAPFYHAVFIEKDSSSLYYDRLADFDMEKYEFHKREYEMHCQNYHKEVPNLKIRSFSIPSEIKTWNYLRQLDSTLYLYAPSDWGSNHRFQFTDSTYISWNMDGPFPQPIIDFKALSENEYEFEIMPNYMDSDLESIKLKIKIIDKQKGLAVLTSQRDSTKYQSLIIMGSHVKNFPIVVNYCKSQKVMEFRGFDNTDIKLFSSKTKTH